MSDGRFQRRRNAVGNIFAEMDQSQIELLRRVHCETDSIDRNEDDVETTDATQAEQNDRLDASQAEQIDRLSAIQAERNDRLNAIQAERNTRLHAFLFTIYEAAAGRDEDAEEANDDDDSSMDEEMEWRSFATSTQYRKRRNGIDETTNVMNILQTMTACH